MPRRVLITGSRMWNDETPIRELMESLPLDAVIIVGDNNGTFDAYGNRKTEGVDRLAFRCAKRCGLKVEVYRANWDDLGKAAGPNRNQRMVDEGKPTEAVAYPMSSSRGTWDCIRRVQNAGVPVTVRRCAA